MFEFAADIPISEIASIITILLFIALIIGKFRSFLKTKEADYQEFLAHYEKVRTEVSSSLIESKTQQRRQDVNIFLNSLQRQVSDLETRTRTNLYGFVTILGFIALNFKVNINQNIVSWVVGALKAGFSSTEIQSFSATNMSFFVQTVAFSFVAILAGTLIFIESKNLNRYRALGRSIHEGIAEAMTKYIPSFEIRSPEELTH